MSDTILVINSGSSSVKSALYSASGNSPILQAQANGLGGSAAATLKITQKKTSHRIDLPAADHESALSALLNALQKSDLTSAIKAVGHRVVHGGEFFSQAHIIDNKVKQKIHQCEDLAPLHNPANLSGIEIVESLLPGIPQVAVFDTAFHRSLPPRSFHYAIPARWYRQYKVRRFGFHGINHQYIAETSLPLLDRLQRPQRIVSAHLGNGCSICAIKDGHSIDTSMGFTPLEGLMMGTRSGDIDAGLLEYLCEKENMNMETATHILNKESGLKGVSELSNDMRELLQASDNGHAGAELAINLFCYRLAKAIASYLVPLGTIEAIVFTGGIGEHAAPIRQRVTEFLSGLNFHLDADLNNRNESHIRNIAGADSRPVFIIPANEEWMIAHQSWKLIQE
ncbi:acetate kinase [Ketobacter sp. MCCC 1A13808]|nr:acetate kinase [Ketobacter sp. MCCC 1A13808]RLP56528.1 MAG: acetate kinase [Ketobacter sp.]